MVIRSQVEEEDHHQVGEERLVKLSSFIILLQTRDPLVLRFQVQIPKEKLWPTVWGKNMGQSKSLFPTGLHLLRLLLKEESSIIRPSKMSTTKRKKSSISRRRWTQGTPRNQIIDKQGLRRRLRKNMKDILFLSSNPSSICFFIKILHRRIFLRHKWNVPQQLEYYSLLLSFHSQEVIWLYPHPRNPQSWRPLPFLREPHLPHQDHPWIFCQQHLDCLRIYLILVVQLSLPPHLLLMFLLHLLIKPWSLSGLLLVFFMGRQQQHHPRLQRCWKEKFCKQVCRRELKFRGITSRNKVDNTKKETPK